VRLAALPELKVHNGCHCMFFLINVFNTGVNISDIITILQFINVK
jgi:hypothetical protein